MAKTQEFAEWCGDATEKEIAEMKAVSRKNFMKWLLISLIPFVGFFTMGCAIFCYNTTSFISTRGHGQGSNLLRIVLLLLGGIIIPIIVVQILAHSNKLGDKVVGFDKLYQD